MFEQSLLESTKRIPAHNRWSIALSVAIQASIAAAVVLIPLLHPEVLRRVALSPPQLIAPAPELPPPPPPPVHLLTRVEAATTAPAAAAAPAPTVRATFHSAVDIAMRAQPGEEAPPGMPITPGGGLGSSSSTGTNPFGTAPSGPAVSAATPAKPARISTGVSAGLLMGEIRPAYPRIAISARAEGTVVVHAIISQTGFIESASVVSGPAMLQGAALDAVKAARYHPYHLNGEPVEVDTTINIVFHLND